MLKMFRLSDSVVVVAQENTKVFRACGRGRSNTALDGPRINKSDCGFQSSFTITEIVIRFNFIRIAVKNVSI